MGCHSTVEFTLPSVTSRVSAVGTSAGSPLGVLFISDCQFSVQMYEKIATVDAVRRNLLEEMSNVS